MGRHFSEVDFFRSIFDGILLKFAILSKNGVLTMVIIKSRNAVKIRDKMTFCPARFSQINVRHLTDCRFKWVRGFPADDFFCQKSS